MTKHSFDSTILREYDIRGIVDKTLHGADATAIGRAFGTVLRRQGGRRVAVGRDGRLSSPALEAALVDGLRDTGIEVVRIGLGPTPMLYFAVYHLRTDGGIMITGSHNPPDYNGFKMMLGKRSFFGADIQELGRIAALGDYETGSGAVQDHDLVDDYIERLARDFTGRPLKVVWDPGNGATGEVVTRLVAKLPGDHLVINGAVDGRFPAHHPDPTEPKNLEQLRNEVISGGRDLGIAFDGDGDRIGALDGEGNIVWGDQLLAILAKDVLEELPGATIIADVKASQVLFDHIGALGGKPLMWRTGHSLIKSKMAETGAPLAGEMSGHIFFAHKYYGFDDAIYAAIRLLNAITHSGRGLAALRAALPAVVNTPELRFPCPEERKFQVVKEVQNHLKSLGVSYSDVDGVRMASDGGWWLLRASNTQDVLVARCEAPDRAGLERQKQGLVRALQAVGFAPPAI